MAVNRKYEVNYVSESDIKEFRLRAKSAMQTKEMMSLIRQSIIKVKEYPKHGEMYYKILDLKYLNYFQYCEEEILDQINVDRSTYFRKKKEAMYLLGYTLFGLVIPNYIIRVKAATA